MHFSIVIARHSVARAVQEGVQGDFLIGPHLGVVVDDDGLVTGIKEGKCVIMANATDGSNKTTYCLLNIISKNKQKEDVNDDGEVDISDVVSIINAIANNKQ